MLCEARSVSVISFLTHSLEGPSRDLRLLVTDTVRKKVEKEVEKEKKVEIETSSNDNSHHHHHHNP